MGVGVSACGERERTRAFMRMCVLARTCLHACVSMTRSLSKTLPLKLAAALQDHLHRQLTLNHTLHPTPYTYTLKPYP